MKTFSMSSSHRKRWAGFIAAGVILGVSLVTPGCGGSGSSSSGLTATGGTATMAQVIQGRNVVLTHACANCHSQDINDPSSAKWLAGWTGGQAPGTFQVGPFTVNAPNLTPDPTGLAGVTSLQIYNALKHGLDPKSTPSVVITGDTPGQGNFPATPHYLAPIMPWASFRHMTDNELWSVVAYLQHGIKPVNNVVPEGTEPPDFWASNVPGLGPVTVPPYPAASEAFNP